MARTTINTQGIPNGTIVSADLSYPLTDFSSTGIDDNASTTALTIDSSGNITVTGTVDGRDLATDGTKLDNIEANADVTDTTNVTAAGALMDSELTDLAGVKGVTISTLQPKPSEGAFADGDKTKLDGIEASATNYGDSDVATYISGNRSYGNITTTGYIAGPSTFTIDPAAVGDNTGTLVIAGNLQVDGTTTTINSTTMTVDDLNITLASGAANAAAANGAGITVDGASATLTYNGTNDDWNFNKALNVSGNLTSTGIDDNAVSTAITIDSSQDVTFTSDAKFPDSGKAIFGAGSDLEIYHDGSNSYIKDVGTGTLNLQGATQVLIASATTGEVGLQFVENAGVTLRHNNVAKLVTTSTGIDVTGTVTADSATIDGAVSVTGSLTTNQDITISETIPRIVLDDTSATDYIGVIRQANSNLVLQSQGGTGTYGGIQFKRSNGTSDTSVLDIELDGDVAFYADDGTTQAFFWDASAESLGIGTTSPDKRLDVLSGTANSDVAAFSGTSTGRGLVISTFDDTGTNADAMVDFDAISGAGQLSFSTGTSERMRIGSSGNVLITSENGLSSLSVTNNPLTLGSLTSFNLAFDPNEIQARNNGASNDLLLNKNGGNVGIGTNVVNALLHVNSGTSNIPAIFESTDSIAGIQLKDNSGNVELTTTAGNFEVRPSGGSVVATVSTSGDLSIIGNLDAGDGTNISMGSLSPGQLKIAGSGYTGAIALDANAMHIYHNSATRDIIFGTNETAQLRIDTSGNLDFLSGYIEKYNSELNGYIVGGYNSISSSANSKTNPIYAIGSAYTPASETSVGGFYGIGMTRARGSTSSFLADLDWTLNTGWGLYVAAGSGPTIFLDATNGDVNWTGNLAHNGTVVMNSSRDLKNIPLAQIGSATNLNNYGIFQVNQPANNDESGIGILSASAGRSMRIWVDESDSYISSGNGGSGNLIFNEAITVSSTGDLTGVGSITPAADDTHNLGTSGTRWANVYTDELTTGQSTFTITDTTANSSFDAVFIDYNLSGSDSLTADRTKAGLRIDMDSSATGGDVTNEHRLHGINVDVRATGDSDLIYGTYSYAESQNNSDQITQVTGVLGYAVSDDTGTGHTANVYGVQGLAYGYGTGSGGTSSLYALWGKTLLSTANDKDTANAVGVYGEVEIDNAGQAQTLTSVYAFQGQIDDDSAGNVTITNGYLFYGNYAGTLPTNAYGLYIADAVESYFGGGDVTGVADLTTTGTVTATGGNSTNWNTAYGWGNHASAGYLTSFDITTQTDPKYVRSDTSDTMSGSFTATGEVNAYSGAIDLRSNGIYFESGDHCITWNDGNGNFNIRVGNDPSEICTEAGYVFQDEWSQSGGWREFNVSSASLAIGNSVTWRPQIYYDYNEVSLRYQGSEKLATTSGGVDVTGDFTNSGDIQSKSQIRAQGWWNTSSGGYGDAAVEIGMSGGDGYILSYNRNAGSYGTLNLQATSISLTPVSSGQINLTAGTTNISGTLDFGNARIYADTHRAGLLAVANDTGTWSGVQIINGGYEHALMADDGGNVGLYNDNNNEWMIYCTDNGAVSLYYDNSQKIYTYASGGRVTGDFLATGDIYAYYSDERLKDKTGKIENALDKVDAIETFYYTHNDKANELGYGGKDQQVGVSAQSVAEVMPEVVHLAPIDDDGHGNSVSGENYKTVNYARLVPLLIESIKELRAEIEELKK